MRGQSGRHDYTRKAKPLEKVRVTALTWKKGGRKESRDPAAQLERTVDESGTMSVDHKPHLINTAKTRLRLPALQVELHYHTITTAVSAVIILRPYILIRIMF